MSEKEKIREFNREIESLVDAHLGEAESDYILVMPSRQTVTTNVDPDKVASILHVVVGSYINGQQSVRHHSNSEELPN